jgi:hypothetical protein
MPSDPFMNPFSRILSCLCWLLSLAAHAQSFDLEQFEQVFRPRLRMDARYQTEAAYADTAGRLGVVEGTMIGTFPLHSHFKAGFQVDTASRGLKELLKNSIRMEASQLLGSVRFGARQVQLGFDSIGMRQLFSASAGLMGIKLTRKYRVLFWSANVNASEEDRTLDALVPRFNGVIGKLRVKGLRKQFFYGLAFSYTDGLALPVPFLGGTAPLGGDWSFNYVLPAQACVGYRPKAGTRVNMGVTADGFRSGIEWQGERANVNHAQLRAFVHARHRVNKNLQVRVDAGYVLAQTVRFTDADARPLRYPAEGAFSFGLGVNVLFGGSVMQRLLDEVLK